MHAVVRGRVNGSDASIEMNLGHSSGLHERRQERQVLMALVLRHFDVGCAQHSGVTMDQLDEQSLGHDLGSRPGRFTSMMKGAYGSEARCPRRWLSAPRRVPPMYPQPDTPALAIHLIHRSARCRTSQLGVGGAFARSDLT